MIAANQITKAGIKYIASIVPMHKVVPAVATRQPVLLVVDNYPPGQRLLRELARYTGLDTIVCTTVVEALACLDEHFVVGVVMDSDILSRAWDDFIQALHGSQATEAKIPVIQLSAFSFSPVVPEMGVTAVLQKPICVAQFFDMLDRCIAPRLEEMRLTTQQEGFPRPCLGLGRHAAMGEQTLIA